MPNIAGLLRRFRGLGFITIALGLGGHFGPEILRLNEIRKPKVMVDLNGQTLNPKP